MEALPCSPRLLTRLNPCRQPASALDCAMRMAAHLAFAPQNGLRHYLKHAVRRPDLQGPLPLELLRRGAAAALLRGDDRAGALWRASLHAVLPLFQIPEELQSQSAPALRRTAAGDRATAHLQRAVRHRPADRGGLRHGVSAREAGNPGAGRLDRRDPGGGRRHCGALCGAGPPDRLHSPHQPPRLQGRRAGCRA